MWDLRATQDSLVVGEFKDLQVVWDSWDHRAISVMWDHKETRDSLVAQEFKVSKAT